MMLASGDLMFSRSWKYVPMPLSSPQELAAYAIRWCPKPMRIVPTYRVPPRDDRIARRVGADPASDPPLPPPRIDIAEDCLIRDAES